MEHLAAYLRALQAQLDSPHATEHSHRPALQTLLEALLPSRRITNEPTRTQAGAPDFIITQADTHTPIAYVETKPIDDSDLHGRRHHKEQFDRYKRALGHVLFTDYLRFHLYQGHTHIASATVGELTGQGIQPRPEGHPDLLALIAQLDTAPPQPARTARALAARMAAKTQLLAHALRHTLQHQPNDPIHSQLRAFRKVLLHEVTEHEFADLYAQTITYGLFAARLQQPPHHPFTRQHAATLIPETNQFLRQIFQHIAGYSISPTLEWIVQALTHLLALSDVPALMAPHQATHRDPIVHFYEDFLAAYDPTVRRARGVWYTPTPVVNFIVRAADTLLRTQFHLPLGLADTQTARGQHRVQILDPAAGTGAFLAGTIRHIHQQLAPQAGAWPDYASRHLLPRLHGFELLMAPYAIAHMQIDLLLRRTGWQPTASPNHRIGIYLTNALEPQHPDTSTLFAHWLSDEANHANRIKRNATIMVMLGNPPYSVSSRNKGPWITSLLSLYKEGLNERNIQPLSDDYIKFIRLAQHYIDRTGEGIVAFITNSSYLDGIIHRQMRRALRQAFHAIYILDLHGNTRANHPHDENIFGIKTGVCICLLIKRADAPANTLATIYHHEIHGPAPQKLAYLQAQSLESIPWQTLQPQEPYHFFVPKDLSRLAEYEAGFRIDELFISYANGVKTSNDRVNIHFTPQQADTLRHDALHLAPEAFRRKYHAGPDKRDWAVPRALDDVRQSNSWLAIAPYAYRPFDTRYIVYTGKTCGIVAWPRFRRLNFLRHPHNISINLTRSIAQNTPYSHILMARHLPDLHFCAESNYAFPLYRAAHDAQPDNPLALSEPTPNMHPHMLASIASTLGEPIQPPQLMDYIYAILHSPSYRARYEELLRIEFPRIPYPTDPREYHRLAHLGAQLRALHLMDNAQAWPTATTFPCPGSMRVDAVRWANGCVHINDAQHFANVPQQAWLHPIGSYRPAQKWLKDRLGQTLSYDHVRHYACIIHALTRTADIMRQIDTPEP